MNIRYLSRDKIYAVLSFPAFFMIFPVPSAACYLNIANISGDFLFRLLQFNFFVTIVLTVFYIPGSSPYVKTSSADYLRKAV